MHPGKPSAHPPLLSNPIGRLSVLPHLPGTTAGLQLAAPPGSSALPSGGRLCALHSSAHNGGSSAPPCGPCGRPPAQQRPQCRGHRPAVAEGTPGGLGSHHFTDQLVLAEVLDCAEFCDIRSGGNEPADELARPHCACDTHLKACQQQAVANLKELPRRGLAVVIMQGMCKAPKR